jgi:diguanylate cyclase (GGDEF)-like protein
MELDNPTLVIAIALVTLLASSALFVNWAANRHVPGLFKIAVGYFINAAGLILLSQQGYIDPVFSILLANMMTFGGRITSLVGLAEYWNQEDSRLPQVCMAIMVLVLVGYAYFTFIVDSLGWRIALYTPFNVFLHLATVAVLVKGINIERKLRPVMSAGTHYGAYMLIALMVVDAVGESVLAFLRTGDTLFAPDAGTSLLFLGVIFTVVIFPFSIIIMTMEELKVEYAENSIYDPVTTIFNQRLFLEVGQRVIGAALRYDRPVSLLTMEVINMNQIVEQHGHRAGNKLLRHFSLLASDDRRHEDMLARTSFKDFRMLLPGVEEVGARVVAEKIYQANESKAFVVEGEKINIEIVVSAITRRGEDLDLQRLLLDGELELDFVKAGKVKNQG